MFIGLLTGVVSASNAKYKMPIIKHSKMYD